jgi:aspartate/methionine/tyrosine aminotransferase
VNDIELETGAEFVRMEMGVPGLAAPEIGVEAEIDALRRGVASVYPSIEGVPELKWEMARFVRLFLNLEVEAMHCVPSVGAMQGSFATFSVVNRTDARKEGTLFIDPGFPVQKQQVRMMGHNYRSFDVFGFRGERLRGKLESYLAGGKVSSILYSNPNNPSWVCFSELELRIIGELATKYDAVVIEDLAYFGMDFRSDLSVPGVGPFQPTVGHYTDNYILLVSSSKVFSYAGQRVGMVVVSPSLYVRKFPDLLRYFPNEELGHSLVYGALYSLSSGVTHSAQFGVAALLRAANDGLYNFVEATRVYGERAVQMKRLFVAHGFHLVYDMDEDLPLADGFYFTIAYKNMPGEVVLEGLLYCGISALSLAATGSAHSEGLRACVSRVREDQLAVLDARLAYFVARFGNVLG